MTPTTFPSSPRTSSVGRRRGRPGYTLTEILIVIGLIVVMIAVAVPVLNVLSGNRSTEAAENQVTAVLNQARAQAIALQKNVGVLFYVDPASQRYTMALVQQNGFYVDLLPDYDYVPLQTGTGIQLLHDDQSVAPSVAPSGRDRYVRMGVVMFDGRGQAIAAPYLISPNSSVAEVIDLKQILRDNGLNANEDYRTDEQLYSQLGLVIYDNEAFATQNFSKLEKQRDEADECNWLDANAVPFVLNRYNGTLIRGE